MKLRAAHLRFVVLAMMFAGAPLACGARTPLGIPDGVTIEVTVEASIRTRDAARDVPLEALPPIDAARRDVVIPDDCPDADATLVYLLSDQGNLLSFFPPTRSFTPIGQIACDTSMTPNSMAVDRQGVAFANLVDDSRLIGSIWRVSTSTAACAPTSYDSRQGFSHFGMGMVARDGTDHLFISDTSGNAGSLAEVDTSSFAFRKVGDYDRPSGRCELTGTGDGRLFAWCLDVDNGGSNLNEVDPGTAHVIAADILETGRGTQAFAVAFWGGKFYLFGAINQGAPTTVIEFDPVTKTETSIVTTQHTIIGAGVSTCAPL